MPEIIQSRRGFIAGLGALFIAAPAIVRATSIMPVKAIKPPATPEEIYALLKARMNEAYRVTRETMARNLFGDFVGYGGGFSVNDRDYTNLEYSIDVGDLVTFEYHRVP